MNVYINESDLVKALRKNSEKIKLGEKEYSLLEIYERKDLKQLCVKEDPKKAEKFYYLWRECGGGKELGEIFAKKYRRDKIYGLSAYHIGTELKIPNMMEPSNSVRNGAKRAENGGW